MDPEQVLQMVVTEVFSPLYKLAAASAFVYFLYGGVKFMMDLNDPERKNFGKSHLFWGLIGLFIIFSVGGILQVFNDVFDGMFVF